ncbi:MAG: DUF523 domain-containing protein [Pseudomonadota bacterium]
MILVSACLCGQRTRYDGRVLAPHPALAGLDPAAILALCPEVLGGLAVPRPPARLKGATPGREGLDVLEGRARLMTADGRDVTAAFIAGAKEVLRQAQAAGVSAAWLKDRSPSCGYDPRRANPRGGPGLGVLAALLIQNDIPVTELRQGHRGD